MLLLLLGLQDTETAQSISGLSFNYVSFVALKELTPETVLKNVLIPRQVMFVEELVKEFPAFMEHRSSSPCSEVPAI
jgi:hypothetical protein